MIKYTVYIMSLFFTCGVYATAWQDSFDDNSRDVSLWRKPASYLYPSNSANIAFSETNQRLEYVVSDGTADHEAGAWQTSLSMLSEDLNWSVTADIQNSANVSSNNFVGIGIGVYASFWDSTTNFYLFLNSTTNGLSLTSEEGFYSEIEPFAFPEPLSPDGSIRISYTATNQLALIEYATAPDYQYHVVRSLDTSSWDYANMASGFILDTWAQSKRETVVHGEVFLDNILVDYENIDIAVGPLFLETTGNQANLSIQLEQSDDLITWTNAGNPVEWVIPVETNKQFFRVRTSP